MLHVMFRVTSAAEVGSRVANKGDWGGVLLTQLTFTFGYSLVVK